MIPCTRAGGLYCCPETAPPGELSWLAYRPPLLLVGWELGRICWSGGWWRIWVRPPRGALIESPGFEGKAGRSGLERAAEQLLAQWQAGRPV